MGLVPGILQLTLASHCAYSHATTSTWPIVPRCDVEETAPALDEPRFVRLLLEQHATPFFPLLISPTINTRTCPIPDAHGLYATCYSLRNRRPSFQKGTEDFPAGALRYQASKPHEQSGVANQHPSTIKRITQSFRVTTTHLPRVRA